MHVKSQATSKRRLVLQAAAAAVSAAFAAQGALAQVPAMPKSPVTINIVDVAGNLALTQDAIEQYQKSRSNLVAKVNFTKAPAPELPGKLKAMQGAGRSDIDLVLTGTDFLAAGIEQGVLTQILPMYSA
jgi:putative spermidine/putrescine transport system substrate-binding protein